MSTDIIDVNTETDSSTVSATASEGAEQDVNSTATESSTEATATEQTENTLESVLEESLKAATSSEVDGDKQADSEEKSADDQEPSDEQPKTVELEKKPIPYERFQEVNAQKTQFERQISEFKPLAEAQKGIHDYCTKNNVTPEDFNYWLEVAATVKNDPAKALELLQPQLQQLQSFKGDTLSPELQAAVDNGEISQAYAKRIAAAESQQKWNAERTKHTEAQRKQELTARYQTEMTNSLVTWAETKAGKMPDFKPKAGPNGEDGVYELFINKLTVELPGAKIEDDKSLIAFAEKTLESVLKTVGRFTVKPSQAGNKVLRTSQTNGGPVGAPKSVDEAITQAARRHGVMA